MIHLRFPFLLGLALMLAACGVVDDTATPPALPKLATVVVEAPVAGGSRAWDGVVAAVQRADLAAQTSGRVTEVAVDVNDRVHAGDVLLRLTAVEQQAGADAARAQLRMTEANAAEAEASFVRFAALADKQYVSRLQFDQARATRDAAVANRDSARAQLAQAMRQADYTVVRAPFAGIISARDVEPGESISPGQSLLSVYAPGALRIEVQVPQSDAQAIRAAGQAQVVLADGRRMTAAAVTVFPAADPATHSVAVRVTLPEDMEPLSPGITATVVFPVGGESVAVRIPRSALVQRGEVSGAYVLDGSRLALRQLRLGQVMGNEVEVLAGLKAGEILAADPVAAGQAMVAQRKAMSTGNE